MWPIRCNVASLSISENTNFVILNLVDKLNSFNINVNNDYLQFLAEHGLVGFGCLVAIFVMLLVPIGKIWSGMAKAIRFESSRKQPPQPRSLFVFPAAAFSLLLAAVCTLIHSFGDCPLRSPVLMSLFFIELAAADGFLPYMIEHKEKE